MNIKNSSFIKYNKENIKITIRSDIKKKWVDWFIDNFCCNKSDQNGEILYNKRNKITRIDDKILDKSIAVKNFKLEKTYDQLRFRLISSKAERSLKIARAIQKIALNTPAPLAVIEKRGKTNELLFSYYITDYVDYDFNMLDIAKEFKHPERYKIKELMPQLGQEVRKMHEANIIHNDLHAGNILVKDFDSEPKLFYIDLNRGRVNDNLSDRDKINDLKRLKFTDQEKKIFFKSYDPQKWEYYFNKVSKARKKRRKFVKAKHKIRKFLGIKKD